MTQITAISRERHADKRWKRSESYAFTANDAVAPLVAQELSRACLSMPIGFVQTEDAFQLVAVQGLQAEQNLWLSPDGRWFGPYVPAVYRSYPFALAKSEDDRRVLCIREDSGLITESEGERFFDEAGQPSQPVQEVLRFLELLANNAQQTAAQCAILMAHHLIQPWNIQLKSGEAEQTVKGLFRVDEAALNALPTKAFEMLRKAGALPLVYCQLLSMQHINTLGKLANRQAQGTLAAQQPDGDLDLEFLKNDGNLRFH